MRLNGAYHLKSLKWSCMIRTKSYRQLGDRTLYTEASSDTKSQSPHHVITLSLMRNEYATIWLRGVTVRVRPASSHPAGSRIPSCDGWDAGWAGPIPRVLHISHSVMILLYNVEIQIIFYDHIILWESRVRKVKASSMLYVFIVKFSINCQYSTFCQGMHPGIIDACFLILFSLATFRWPFLAY